MARLADLVVVGGGIVGLAVAYTTLLRRPGASVVLLEKENRLAAHQTGHNSGVIHAGVYYEPGSLKARLCRAGLLATLDFCRQHDVAHAQCGKLIVAVDDAERPGLRKLQQRAEAQGTQVEWLEAPALHELEPQVAGVAALRVGDTGMVDYPGLCARLAALITAHGGQIELDSPVVALREQADQVDIDTPKGSRAARQLIVCGGLQADRLLRMAGLEPDFAIVPFRGDYFRLPDSRAGLVRHHIYPVPDAALPFLGIHLTRMIDGGISVGPSAMLALARERYTRFAWDGTDAFDIARFPGTWALLRRYRQAGWREFACALSRRRYLREVQRYCPQLVLEDLQPMPPGIRAQAVSRDGQLIHDFLLKQTARSLHVCNAPSPAATAALPIAAEIVNRAGF